MITEEKTKTPRSKKANFILCILSSVFLSLGFGSLMVLGNFNVYIVSYIHEAPSQKYVNLQYGNLMVPILTFAMTCFSPISGPIEKKFGPKFTIILGQIIIAIFLILFYFQQNIWFAYVICFGIGFGYSIMAMIPIKNACFYYPKYKGIIATSFMSFGTIFSSIFNLVGEKIIVNPKGKEIIDGFYPEDVSKNIKTLIIYIGIISAIGTLFGIICFMEYNSNLEEDENNIISSNDNNIEFLKKDENYNLGIKKILKNYRIWLIAIFGCLGAFYCGFALNTFRTFISLTQNTEEDMEFIQYLGSIILICLCISGPIWGFLSDKLRFRITIVTISFLGILDSVGLAIFLNHKIMYRILICACTVIMSGIMSVLNPHIMEVFGIKYSLELTGIAGLFSGIANLGGAITSFVFGIIWDKAEEIIEPYRIVFIVGASFSIIAFILQWFEPSEKFEFNIEEVVEQKTDDNNKEDEILRPSTATTDSNY